MRLTGRRAPKHGVRRFSYSMTFTGFSIVRLSSAQNVDNVTKEGCFCLKNPLDD